MKASQVRARKRWRWGVPHVDHQVDRHGHARWWYRRDKGPRLAALPMPGSKDFHAAWEAAHRRADGLEVLAIGAAMTRAGSLSAALVAYYGSTAWQQGLAIGSRKMRRPILEKLRGRYGEELMRDLKRDHVQKWLKPLLPNAQKNWMKALGHFMKFALAENLVQVDPLAGVVKDKAARSDGHIAFTEDDVELYRSYHKLGTRERLALEIMLNLGLRRSDACLVGPSDIKGGWLRDFEPKKTARTTGVKINVPLHDDLTAAIKAMNVVSTKTFLVTNAGKSFASEASFGNWMRKACDAAGLSEVSSHGLRKAAAIRLAYAGAQAPELMKVFGWRTITQAQVYVDQADAMRMSASAMARLVAYQKANKD
jgi:integrase